MDAVAQQHKAVAALKKAWYAIPDAPIAKKQKQYPRDAPAKGPVWVSRGAFAAPPERSLVDAVYSVFDELTTASQPIRPARDVELRDVRVEWLGDRTGVDGKAPEPAISEREKFEGLQRDRKADVTVLYAHGGAFYAGSAVATRAATSRLARQTHGAVASMSYRLAPQNPFPAALLDVFVAYLNLLYPPAGACHAPVRADRVVLAGDSAGANLCLALTQVLLTLQRRQTASGQAATIMFNGREVSLHLPAGMAFLGPWCDVSDSLPSYKINGRLDIITDPQPMLKPDYPTDHVWPTTPPRGHPYCEVLALDHPLVSPSAAADWSGSPPIYMALGAEERGLDGAKAIACHAAGQGVAVFFDEYEGMTHEFAMLLGRLPQSAHCFRAWAEACRTFTQGGGALSSRARLLKMPQCEPQGLDVRHLLPMSFEEVRRTMREHVERRPSKWVGLAKAAL